MKSCIPGFPNDSDAKIVLLTVIFFRQTFFFGLDCVLQRTLEWLAFKCKHYFRGKMVFNSCFQAKYILSFVVVIIAVVAYFALDLFYQFQPEISSHLPPNNVTEMYALVLPVGLTWDYDDQTKHIDEMSEKLDSVEKFHQVTAEAAELFVTNETVSVLSPVMCSFQLYDEPPRQDDMWTARGVMISASNVTEAKRLAYEFGQMLSFPIQAVRIGPGPFVAGDHVLGQGYIFALFGPYWAESVIDVHAMAFGFKDKFVMIRIEVIGKNSKDDLSERQYVIMQEDTLDLYEQLHPRTGRNN